VKKKWSSVVQLHDVKSTMSRMQLQRCWCGLLNAMYCNCIVLFQRCVRIAYHFAQTAQVLGFQFKEPAISGCEKQIDIIYEVILLEEDGLQVPAFAGVFFRTAHRLASAFELADVSNHPRHGNRRGISITQSSALERWRSSYGVLR